MKNGKRKKEIINEAIDLWGEADILNHVTMNNIYYAKMFIDERITKEKYKETLNVFFIDNKYLQIIESLILVHYSCKDADIRPALLEGINNLRNGDILDISIKELKKHTTIEELKGMISLYREFLTVVLVFIYDEIILNINKFNIQEEEFNGLQLAVLFHKN